MKTIIKKTLKLVISWIVMFLMMNDKVGYSMQDKLSKPKL